MMIRCALTINKNIKIFSRQFSTNLKNDNGYNSSFKVSIVTGNRRGASTSAAVFVQMIGRDAQTDRVFIDADFKRGSTVHTNITTPVPLGALKSIWIGHDSNGEVGVGWYVDRVELEYNKICHTFPVHRWLGESDIGAGTFPASIQLKVGIKNSISEPSISYLSPESVGSQYSIPFWVRTGVAAFPHPDKVIAGEKAVVRQDIGQAGEDAYSISSIVHPTPELKELEAHIGYPLPKKMPTTTTICVADGVYSWRNEGIDAGEWSRFFTRTVNHQAHYHVRDDTIEREAMAPWYEEYASLNIRTPTIPLYHPKQMMQAAELKTHKTDIRGSSTACIASIHGIDRMLYIANLGDSGVIVLRRNHGVIFRTPEQEHYLGCPFQLGHFEGADTAEAAQLFHMRLARGDIIVVASDGLYDNVSESEMEELAAPYLKVHNKEAQDPRAATRLAYAFASLAFRNSIDPNKDTPYSRGAAEEFNLVWRGGKKDDITVICALVET